jgi:hypothetical protein
LLIVQARIDLTKATAKVLIALFVLSCGSRAHSWQNHDHTTQSLATDSLLRSSAAYELDTDLKADQIAFESNGFDKTISIKFGNLRSKELGFATRSDDTGNLIAGDLDRDGDVDLIWVGSEDRNDAVVLINQGEGNFAQVSDNAPYASELDELFNTGDSPHKQSLKKHRKSSSLTSSSFSEIGPGLKTQFRAPTVQEHSVTTVERVADRLAILTDVSPRGPPSIFS